MVTVRDPRLGCRKKVPLVLATGGPLERGVGAPKNFLDLAREWRISLNPEERETHLEELHEVLPENIVAGFTSCACKISNAGSSRLFDSMEVCRRALRGTAPEAVLAFFLLLDSDSHLRGGERAASALEGRALEVAWRFATQRGDACAPFDAVGVSAAFFPLTTRKGVGLVEGATFRSVDLSFAAMVVKLAEKFQARFSHPLSMGDKQLAL